MAHLREGKPIKGYADTLPTVSPENMLQQEPVELPREFGVRLAESNDIVSLRLEALKALFFVKTFEGHKEYKEIKFFDTHPPVEGLWVRMKFYDGETFEGILHNCIHYLVNPGFFLKPPDPQSNNEIVYIVKASLTEFRVLGLKMSY